MLLSVLFWSIWRRIYGEGTFKKYLNRSVQTIIAIAVLTGQLSDWQFSNVLIAFPLSVYIIIQYWSRAVGCILDAGLNPVQNKENYNTWYKPICNRIVSCLNWLFDSLHTGWHINKYYGIYDFIYSSIRNFIGVLPALFFYPSWLWLIVIFDFYPVYRGCYYLFEKYPSLFTNKYMVKLTLNEPKNLAEILVGSLFGIVVGVL